jgi:hypothetical protein
MAGSRKQQIYNEFLFWSLPWIRNVQTWAWWNRVRRGKACYYEAEFVHNLPQSILEPEFVDHDAYFLNTQAKMFYNHCKSAPHYDSHIALIRELFALLPEKQRALLRWKGPDSK